MDWFDLMSSDHFHVILHPDKKHGLIFNRLDNTISTINHDDAKELSNLKKINRVYGIVGRYLNKYLVLIKNRSLVGTLYEPKTKTEHNIFVITQVQVVDTSCLSSSDATSNSVRYDVSSKNQPDSSNESSASSRDFNTGSVIVPEQDDFSSLPITISTSSGLNSRAAPWNPFRLANPLKPISTSNSQAGPVQPEESDKRLVEEMIKLFNNTNSFYFSPTLDLTNRFSRKNLVKQSGNEMIWKTANKRFFWNRHMLKDLIELSVNDPQINYFISVILQGFISVENHTVAINTHNDSGVESGLPATYANATIPLSDSDYSDNVRNSVGKKQPGAKTYQLALISRRSVFQAGTRYRRRGVDEQGNCANFVETEQVFRYNQHFTSLIILRGSIPLYWYQTGYNYRPPPVLFRSEAENQAAFTKHFLDLIESYETDHIVAVDCTEQTGREKCLHGAYKSYMARLQSTNSEIKLIEFDFHRYCRGRQCSDVQVERHLRSCGLSDELIKGARYYWNDGEVVWNQDTVFRVNCLDCSDRTNVVQRAIALQILDLQLARLGIIAPDTCPEDNEYRKKMQVMWSTNGNVLSTQYCGTRALFTGDTKLSGYLKDTYSSASRYYISKFRDVYRQAAIDAMLGVENLDKNSGPPDSKEHNSAIDQYELMNFEPLLRARGGGGALIRDVGNRVTNRLARLKGKFHVRPLGVVHTINESNPDLSEATVVEALDDLNIDWPSTDSAETKDDQVTGVFAQLANCNDSFQDDEFGQLMLSLDLSELQKLRDEENKNEDQDGSTGRRKSSNCEEFDMKETGYVKAGSSEPIDKRTSTTST